jgi:hypothetical protein
MLKALLNNEPALAIASFVAGAFLVVLALAASSPPSPRVRTELPLLTTRPGAPVLTGRSPLPGRRRPTSLAQPVHVLVTSAKDSSPTSGATVQIAQAKGVRARGSSVFVGDAVVVSTDIHGHCAVAAPVADSKRVRVSARAAGYGPSERYVVATPGQTVRLQLPAGKTISGRVVDRLGDGVPSVFVIATPSGEGSPRDWTWGQIDSFGQRKAVTESDGSFVLTEMADGPYRLTTHGDGWIEAEPDPRDQDPREAWGGDSSIELEVEAVRAFRVRTLDAETLSPVASTVNVISVRGQDGIRDVPWIAGEQVFSGAGWLRTMNRMDDPDLLVGLVRTTHHRDLRPSAELTIGLAGYWPGRAVVRLWRPSELSDGSSVDEVLLTRVSDRPCGSLVLDCARDIGQLWRPGYRLLYLESVGPSSDGQSQQPNALPRVFGRRLESKTGGDSWVFEGIPLGTYRVRVRDGISMSNPTAVEVRGSDPDTTVVSWPTITGISLSLADEAGERRLQPHRIVITPLGSEEGVLGSPWLGRVILSPGGGEPKETMQALRAGRYRVYVQVGGFLPQIQELTVEAGGVAHIHFILSRAHR